MRQEIIEGINEYGEYLSRQQIMQDSLKQQDQRSEEEKIASEEIRKKVCALGGHMKVWLL